MVYQCHLKVTTSVLLSSLFASVVAGVALQNITLPLPAGSTTHGTPGLLCIPTKWSDIASFYLFNYIAHAATVLTRPGERSDDFLVAVIGSLLFPALGLYRGIEAILSGATFVKGDDLRKAARSGALCIVVRGADWRPMNGQEIRPAFYKPPVVVVETEHAQDSPPTNENHALHLIPFSPPYLSSKFGCPIYVHRQIIHGTYSLPPGYRFAILPSDTVFESPRHGSTSTIEISATHNFVKALVAIAQTCYACLTLYRARGDQVSQFGFAAFGLTVAPYAVMSVMNLVGNLCRPEYASLYMVESRVMDEAKERGGMFQGAVGRVQEDERTWNSEADDVERIDDLHFSGDESGEPMAVFSTRERATHTARSKFVDLVEKTGSECAAQRQRTYPLRPIPKGFNYTGTSNDALLLIPCCPSFSRTCSSNRLAASAKDCNFESLAIRPVAPLATQKWWCPHFSAFVTHTLRWRLLKYSLTIVVALVPIVINGTISGFRPGSISPEESATWKVYTMQWLVFGVCTGLWWVMDQEGKDALMYPEVHLIPLWRAVWYVISASPAVGGFVVTGQMLERYGVCMWVGG